MVSGRGHQVTMRHSKDRILPCDICFCLNNKTLIPLNILNTGEPWQFTDWGPGKPENDGTALNILWDFYSECMWKWNDDNTDKETPFICENKITSVMNDNYTG